MNELQSPPLPYDAQEIVRKYLLNLQINICQSLQEIDATSFIKDPWNKNDGNGITCVLTNGNVFAKAAVNFSHVWGNKLPSAAQQHVKNYETTSFSALGVSVIVHPENPYVPTSHFNLRFFMTDKKNNNSRWWFGGGMDLTPYYGFREDCIHWHETAMQACKPFGETIYSIFKESCDNYFYLPHRKEARGIGGLFFDNYNTCSFEHSFSLAQSIGNNFINAYRPIVLKRLTLPFSAQEKNFQLYRRGRYVEFNLLYDRGTLFGLQSNGRIESILLSLPPQVHWLYNWQPLPGSNEEKLYTDFLPPQNWIKVT